MGNRLWASLAFATFICVVLHPGYAGAHPFLSDDDRNKTWHATEGSPEVIFIGDSKKQAPILVLKKNSLSPAIIVVETDARSCDISSSAAQLTVPFVPATAANRASKLLLDASVAKGLISLDGRDLSPIRGKWLQICLGSDAAVAISFTGATFVNLRFEQASSVANAAIATNSGPAIPTQSNTAALGSSSDALEKARQSVFLIRTFDERKEPIATGTGFVVRGDGYAITNFHVVHGASSASAIFNDDPKPYVIELRKMRPDSDLALIKVIRDKLQPLSIQKDNPRQGDDVWALGYPSGLGYTVNRGIVAGLRRISELPKDIRDEMKEYDPRSLWIQTDCTINHGNSGGPLINASGDVVGVNTWTLTTAANTNFALRANQADELLRDVDASPISFAEARERYKSTKTMYGVLPSKLPRIEIPQTATALQLSSVAGLISTGFVKNCTTCSGKGQITVRVKVGQHENGFLIVPDMADVQQDCTSCKGAGKQRLTDVATDRLIENLATTLAGVKRNDAKLQEALLAAHTALLDHASADPVAVASITKKAKGLLAQEKIAPKTPVIAHAIYALSIPGQTEGERIHLAVIADSTQIVALSSPLLVDEISIREVLIGGLVSGTTKSLDGRRIIALQNGFLIPMAEKHVELPRIGRGMR